DYHRVSQLYLPAESRAAAYGSDALGHAKRSVLFGAQAQFAELTLTPLTRANAETIHAQARALLHYSPEPRVVEKLIESAVMTGRDEEALLHLMRFRAAFPEDYARWRKSGVLGVTGSGAAPP
ncbi:MAG: Wzy polymerase domain-containing protein, partial [Burkholderiaceae bacterium]